MPNAAIMSSVPASASPDRSTGCRLVAADGRELVLRSVRVRTEASGGIARVTLSQRWFNPYAEALRVDYQLPLPADGAVSGYRFQVGERVTRARIARKQDAREAFEEAVAMGHTAALLEEERSSLFTQELGNIPPDEEIHVEVEVDQPLKWLSTGPHAGQWEWRFPTVVAPRYMGAEGRVRDAERVSVDVSEALPPARIQMQLAIADELCGAPSSPSHALAGTADSLGLETKRGAPLDRDIVVRWPVAGDEVGASIVVARPNTPEDAEDQHLAHSAFGLLTVVPPRTEALEGKHARDLCVLIDVSGSMSGEPLDQARRVVRALIDTLDENDQLEMIAFSWAPERWTKKPQAMNARNKKAALKWLEAVKVGGATEMRAGIIEALRPLRADAQRQVLVITDGLIGFESEIVAEIRDSLPSNSRVHTLGVGHGVNRSLTGPAARAGGGFEAIVAPGEDVEPMLARLLERTSAPQLVDLRIEGDALLERAPERIPDLFAGAPVRLSLRLRPEGGKLRLRASAPEGDWVHEVHVPACAASEGPRFVTTLFARERVEDLETARAGGESTAELDAKIESIGLELQIATRRTSWVAIDEESQGDPTQPTRQVSVPHALAAGLSAQGVGLRSAAMPMFGGMAPAAAAAPMPAQMVRRRAMSAPSPLMAEERSAGGAAPKGKKKEGVFKKMADKVREAFAPPAPARSEPVFDAMEADYGDLSDEAVDLELAEEAPGGGAEKPVDAQVLVEKDDRLILSFTLDEGLEWDPEDVLELLDENGDAIEAEVDLSTSTAASSLEAGVTIRISLKVDATAGTPTTLRICGLELRLSR